MIEKNKIKYRGRKFGHIVTEITKEKIRNSYYHTHLKGKTNMPIKKGDKLEELYGKEKAKDINNRKSIALKGKHPVNEFKKGYKQTEETKKKLSIYHTGLKQSEQTIQKLLKTRKERGHWYHTDETKRKMRISAIENIKKYRGFIAPNIGRYEKEILDKLQEKLGFSIKRGFFINGYYLDGYCQELNLAIEIDEKYHYKNNILRFKDMEKQNNIIKALNCRFLRIKESDYIDNGILNELKMENN